MRWQTVAAGDYQSWPRTTRVKYPALLQANDNKADFG
jgi:hypothetical protein